MAPLPPRTVADQIADHLALLSPARRLVDPRQSRWCGDPIAHHTGFGTCATQQALSAAGLPLMRNRTGLVGVFRLVGLRSRPALKPPGQPGFDDTEAAFATCTRRASDPADA